MQLLNRLFNWEPVNGGNGERAIVWGCLVILLLATLAMYMAFNNVAQNSFYTADGLFLEDYLIDIFERGVDGRTWNASTLGIFPDLLIYALIRFSTGSTYLAFVGFGLVKIIFYVAFFYGFLSVITQISPIRKLWFSSLCTSLMLLATIFLYNQFGSRMITVFSDFVQLVTIMSHGLTIANAALAILLVLLWLRDPSKGRVWILLLFVLSIAAITSDRLYNVVLVAPVMGAVVILSVLRRVSWQSVVWLGSVFLLSNVISQKLYHALGPAQIFSYDLTLTGGWKPVYEFYISVYNLGWYVPIVIFSFVCLTGVHYWCMYSAWKARGQQVQHGKSFNQQETAKLFLLPYAALVMPVSFLAMALINHPGTYNSGGNLLALSFWPFLLVMSPLGLKIWAKGLFHVLSITTLMAYVGVLAASSPTPLSIMLLPSYPASKVGDCLDAHAIELGDGAGIADYWLARPINLFSKKGIRVYQAQGPDLAVFQWNGSQEVLRDRKYTFVITNFASNLQPILEQDVLRIQGQPDGRFVCEGLPVLVYKSGMKGVHFLQDSK